MAANVRVLIGEMENFQSHSHSQSMVVWSGVRGSFHLDVFVGSGTAWSVVPPGERRLVAEEGS